MRTQLFSPTVCSPKISSAWGTSLLATSSAKVVLQSSNGDTFTPAVSKAENRSGLNTQADLEHFERRIANFLTAFETSKHQLRPKMIERDGQQVLTIFLEYTDRLGKSFHYELGRGLSWDNTPHYYLDSWESNFESPRVRLFESHKPTMRIINQIAKSLNTVQVFSNGDGYYELRRDITPNQIKSPLEITSNSGASNGIMGKVQREQQGEAVHDFFDRTFDHIISLINKVEEASLIVVS